MQDIPASARDPAAACAARACAWAAVLVSDAARAAAAAACSTSCLPCAYRPSPTTSSSDRDHDRGEHDELRRHRPAVPIPACGEPRPRCRVMVPPRRSRAERVACSWMWKPAKGMTVSTSAVTMTVTPAASTGHGDRPAGEQVRCHLGEVLVPGGLPDRGLGLVGGGRPGGGLRGGLGDVPAVPDQHELHHQQGEHDDDRDDDHRLDRGVTTVPGVTQPPPASGQEGRPRAVAGSVPGTVAACYCRLMLLALFITRVVMTAPAAIARATMTPIQTSWAGISPRSPWRGAA